MSIRFSQEEFAKLKDLLVIYSCAQKNMKTRLEALEEDFLNRQPYNPIEHIKDRLKSPESIASKLNRRGFPLTAQSARDNLFDIVGLRCICSYARDIFFMADVIKRQPDIKVLSTKDYVSSPKKSGYRSYHMIIEVPIYLTSSTEYMPVEIQLRTQAMDFWASLEHKVRYKYNFNMPEALSVSLEKCADQISEIDNRMFLIQEIADLTNPASFIENFAGTLKKPTN